MSFTPSMDQLCGLSLEVAERYGKPHVGAFYAGSGVKTHKRRGDARCAVCGRPVGSVHHEPPLSRGHVFLLRTKWGQFVLKPSLFALCGSGTTGCHNDFHGGARFKPYWVWRSDEFAEMWWDGTLLKTIHPHSPELYEYGYWRIHDARTGRDIEIGR